jgi:ribonuclease BN (tRNA processing enzyme)
MEPKYRLRHWIRASLPSLGALAALTLSDVTAYAAGAPGCTSGLPGTRAPHHVTRVVLLGTEGGPSVDASRAAPANLLVVDGVPYLIDAGAGVSRRLASAGYSPADIGEIFITHQHIDHNAGLVALISTSWFERSWADEPGRTVQIYGPPATTFLVRKALEFLSVSQRIFQAGVPELKPADGMFVGHDIEEDGVVLHKGDIRVTAVENTHFRTKSYGPTGIRDRSYAYRFDTPSGSVVFTGDTGPSMAVTGLAQGADALVSEVCEDRFCGDSGAGTVAKLDSRAPKMAEAERYHMRHEHLTPEEVGKMAAAANVGIVILTHLVYEPDAHGKSAEVPEFSAGVKQFYSGPVIVGKDLFEYDLVRHSQADADYRQHACKKGD